MLFMPGVGLTLVDPDIVFDDAPGELGTYWEVREDDDAVFVAVVSDVDGIEDGLYRFEKDSPKDMRELVFLVENAYADERLRQRKDVQEFLQQIRKIARRDEA